jgi:hypothetical protein
LAFITGPQKLCAVAVVVSAKKRLKDVTHNLFMTEPPWTGLIVMGLRLRYKRAISIRT